MNTKMRSTIAGITLLCAVGLITVLMIRSGGTPGWGSLPFVTPPGPGEPTVPPEALSMRAAPSATPSLIPPTPSLTPTLTATPTPVPANSSDDVPMVEVPAGEFIMGSSHQQVSEYLEQNKDDFRISLGRFPYVQTPQLIVYLDTFHIDQLEVTVARYRHCVEAGVCRPVANPDTFTDDYPVVGVTWDDANAYCQWVGKRLPTEAEWEKAARGTDGRWYPWGNEGEENKANPSNRVEYLEPVGSYPEGASPYGVLDMGGNALEWTSDIYDPYPGQPDSTLFPARMSHHRIVRGRQVGPTHKPAGLAMSTSNRASSNPNNPSSENIGFRCVEGPEQDWRSQVVRTSIPATPVPQTADLSRMVYVPAGEFVMGRGTEQDAYYNGPAHIVYLDDFYIDRYETTVAEYTMFLNELDSNNCEGFNCVREREGQVTARWIELVDGRYQAQSGFEKRPIVDVSWWGARAYCHWQGKRLPTEAEWEKAARGTDGRLYPWGNNWEPGRAALRDSITDRDYPLDVGTHPDDVSPYGVYDMLGNAREWVMDFFSSDYYLESPYANPQGPESGEDHVSRSLGGPDDGITRRRPGGGSAVSIRCVYTP